MSEAVAIEFPAGSPANSMAPAKGVGLVRAWLLLIAVMVYLMILVGGATRLTDSGLSITEWQPLLGAIPPMSDADWQDAFHKYQTMTAQAQVLNAEHGPWTRFKGIYWWEWGHRQLGRTIGVVFLLPVPVLLADRADDEEADAAPDRAVRAGRTAGRDRLVDGGVGRELRADVRGALSPDDALLSGAADHRLLLLAVA